MLKVKLFGLIIFLIGLTYVVIPGPDSITKFPSLPDSLKSDLPGDTVQHPNIAAYYSQWRRDEITSFYISSYRGNYIFGGFLPPLRLNHPPEEAYQYIRDQQESTFLEEYVYPLRGSLYVNGYEPLVANGKPINEIADNIDYHGQLFASKTTVRFYPTKLSARIFTYLLIWGLGLPLVYLWGRAWKENRIWESK